MQVKYRLEGEDTLHREIRIDIGDDVYAGEITHLPLSSAVLTREQGDGGILATSLSITARSVEDGDADSLYVRDSTRWNVVLYIDGKVYWRGYILRELKETQYRNSPCDIKIQAIDGIGVLKEINYRPSYNRVSIWGVISWIFSRIRLDNELCALASIETNDSSVPSDYDKWLNSVYVNDAVFNEMTAYDILATVTENLSAYFTQVDGNFLFYRTERLGKAQLGAIDILTTDTWYIMPKTGIIGSMTSDADFHPVGTLDQTVEPTVKRLPITLERDSISALGQPKLRIALPTWTVDNDPLHYIHAVDGQRQLYISHGRYAKTISLKAPGYPTKLSISGASVGRGVVYVRVYTGGYVYDFENTKVSEGENRWYAYSGTVPDIGVEQALEGKITLVGSYPTQNIPFHNYRVDQVADLSLELDAFPASTVGNSITLTVEIWVDKEDLFVGLPTAQQMHGVWIDEVELLSEAFDDHKLYIGLNSDAVDSGEEFTMVIQESPDDNGSSLYLPGVLTYSNGSPVHEVTVIRDNTLSTSFNELIMQERAEMIDDDRVVLKGEILGVDSFSHLYFTHYSDDRIYQPTKLDYDILQRISSIELVSVNRGSFAQYPMLSEDDVADDFDTIAEYEYRLKVDVVDVSPAGGTVTKTVKLERYEYGVLVSRYTLTANATSGYTAELISDVDYVTVTGSGRAVRFSEQALEVGKERTAQLLFKHVRDGVTLSKIVTIRQQANSYVDSNKTLLQDVDLVMDNSYVYRMGGTITFDYQNYQYSVTRTWASGVVESGVVVSEKARFELVNAFEGVRLLESGGVYYGVEVTSEAVDNREFTVRVTNYYTGEDVRDYTISQVVLHRKVTAMELRLYNNYEAKGDIGNSINNTYNKGVIVPVFTPANTRDNISIDLGYGVTVATLAGNVISLRPNSGSGSFTITATSERDSVVATLDVITTYNS